MGEDYRYQQYEVLRRDDGSLWELGRGAMGITYKAFDANLRCPVALKVINNSYLNSDLARQRFFHEARAAAPLRHPNIASVFALGTDDHGNYFYAMEFVDGVTVDAYIKREGPLSPVEALRVTLQVSRALAAAAKQQLVHCDLKPANLMLVDQEGKKVVKVTDFGLAKGLKMEGENSGTLTVGGGFVGTPAFASPEQIEERDIDIRSDIYSLGATLYYMIAGRPPYSGSLAQIMSQHLYKSVPLEPLQGLPAAVAALIQRMMEKDREKRFQTPLELHQAILSCLPPASQSSKVANAQSWETAALTSGTSLHQSLTPGAVIGRRYQLVQDLGDEPEGKKFLAKDLSLNCQVTLLVFSREFLSDTKRFTALAEAVDQIGNAPQPTLRQVYYLKSADDFTFLVEEHIAGSTLMEFLGRVRIVSSEPTLLDENVQFTVYRPPEITPVQWYKMLIFAHLDERPEWLDANEPSPIEEVEDEARRILGDRVESYRKTTEESRLPVPREGEITLVPEMQGIEFNPRKRSFLWKDGLCVHLETFELRARPDFVVSSLVRGRVTILLGHLILAEVPLSIRVSQSKASAALMRVPSESSSARRFRRIFASYSHRDLEIVKEMERYAVSLGDRYLRDFVSLRAGERWHQGLLGMITEADIFQLFWSWNSSQSPFVEREWRHALSLGREMFIRPTYWEDPWPDPPDPLRPIHFQRIDVGTASASTAPQPGTTAMTVTLLDLPRMRRALCAPEVVRLLNFLAPLADHEIGHQLSQVDFTLSGVHLTGSESRELLQRPITTWEHLELKVDGIDVSFLPCHTEKQPGSVTQTRGAPDIDPPGTYVRSLSLLAYELLGGLRVRVQSTGHYTPLAALSQEGNDVLRRGLTDEYRSAAELARQFAAVVGKRSAPTPAGCAERAAAPVRSKGRKGLLLIVLIVLIALLLFGYFASRWLVR
jgi:serine/threonine protein kinase